MQDTSSTPHSYVVGSKSATACFHYPLHWDVSFRLTSPTRGPTIISDTTFPIILTHSRLYSILSLIAIHQKPWRRKKNLPHPRSTKQPPHLSKSHNPTNHTTKRPSSTKKPRNTNKALQHMLCCICRRERVSFADVSLNLEELWS